MLRGGGARPWGPHLARHRPRGPTSPARQVKAFHSQAGAPTTLWPLAARPLSLDGLAGAMLPAPLHNTGSGWAGGPTAGALDGNCGASALRYLWRGSFPALRHRHEVRPLLC